MHGTQTGIKYLYPVWLVIKWLLIVTLVSRPGGCSSGHDDVVQAVQQGEGFITFTGP